MKPKTYMTATIKVWKMSVAAGDTVRVRRDGVGDESNREKIVGRPMLTANNAITSRGVCEAP